MIRVRRRHSIHITAIDNRPACCCYSSMNDLSFVLVKQFHITQLMLYGSFTAIGYFINVFLYMLGIGIQSKRFKMCCIDPQGFIVESYVYINKVFFYIPVIDIDAATVCKWHL